MHGVITTYDSKKGTGRIQGDDGFMYFFDRDHVARQEEIASLMMEMEADFTAETEGDKHIATEVKLTYPEKAQDMVRYYSEPPEFLCAKEDLVPGFDVLDRGIYSIFRSERTEEKARRMLIRDCLTYGANSLVSYRVERKLKNAMGHGFEVFTCHGVPVVLGRLNHNGEMRAEDLKHRLNQDKIKRAHDIIVNTRIGKMVLKVLGGILLIIFTIGFIVSGGL